MFAGSLPFEPVWDFSARGERRSVAESLRRLGFERVDILFVHDPDDHMEQALTEAVPALVAMCDAGDVGAIGVGANQVETLRRFVTEAPIDCILMAGRYTLLDQSALEALLPECLDRAIDVFAAGVFNSGILADPDGAEPRYDYAPADAATIARARAIRDICAQHGVPLPAAALQFPFTLAAVRSVIVGAGDPAERPVARTGHPLGAVVRAAGAGARGSEPVAGTVVVDFLGLLVPAAALAQPCT
jgi:D-threo-aldose 1-dehydrogenase